MIEPKKPESVEPLARLRRSLAIILAQAVQEARPGTLRGGGCATDDGFYYDFLLSAPLGPDDLPLLEDRMRALLRAAPEFAREAVPMPQALARLEALGEPYLRALAAESVDRDQVIFQRIGNHLEPSDQPLVTAASEIPLDCFRLRSLAGAYFQGDASNVMLTRIHGWAQLSAAALDAHAQAFEQAAQRDHKKLGRELELFTFDDEIGAGLPLWLPNGTVVRDELEKLMRELEFDAGFERVATPQLARRELYYRTGHLPYYADGMWPFMQRPDDPDGAVFALRPMNCPHHHKLFAARPRSYRELPFRISEYGHVYRYEDSGAVSGLLRVRSMCMNDAHIYCSREQVVPELLAVLDMHEHVYRLLDLQDFRIRLSTRGPARGPSPKFVDDDAGWEESESMLREVLIEKKLPFFEGPGEAAFYGPKIDFQFRMVTGREETASTLQLDFAMARRLDLSYVGPSGAQERPFILHRAPLGTHERFVALLVERFGGAFPTWLAPVQVRILPIHEAFEPYAQELHRVLRAQRVRAQLEPARESLNRRIRAAATQKIPNVLIVGERERAERSVTLRRHGEQAQRSLSFAAFQQQIGTAIATRALSG